MKNDPFETPVTYRIEKEIIWGKIYISKVYYSKKQALIGFKMMNLAKYGENAIYFLITLKEDQVIEKQRIKL